MNIIKLIYSVAVIALHTSLIFALSPVSEVGRIPEYDRTYVSYFSPLEDNDDLVFFNNLITNYFENSRAFPVIDSVIKRSMNVLKQDNILEIILALSKNEDISQRYQPADIIIAKIVFFYALAEEWQGVTSIQDIRFNGTGVFPSLLLSKALSIDDLPLLKEFLKESLVDKKDLFEAKFVSDIPTDNLELYFSKFLKSNRNTTLELKELYRKNKILVRGSKSDIYKFRKFLRERDNLPMLNSDFLKPYYNSDFIINKVIRSRYLEGSIKSSTLVNAHDSILLGDISEAIFKNKDNVDLLLNAVDLKKIPSPYDVRHLLENSLYGARTPKLNDIEVQIKPLDVIHKQTNGAFADLSKFSGLKKKAIAFFGTTNQLSGIEESYPNLLKKTLQVKNPDYRNMDHEQRAQREIIKKWHYIRDVLNNIDVNNYKVPAINNTMKFDLKYMARDLFSIFKEKGLVTSFFMGSSTDELYMLLEHSVISIKAGERKSKIKFMSSNPNDINLIDINKKDLQNEEIEIDIMSRNDFFNTLYSTLSSNYNIDTVKVKRIINHVPGRYTPLILIDQESKKHYLKGAHTGFLPVDKFNRYYEDILGAGVKFVEPERNISGGFMFFFYDKPMILFNYIEGDEIENPDIVNDSLLKDIMDELSKIWNVDVSQYSPQEDFLHTIVSRIVKSKSDDGTPRKIKNLIREFEEEFDSVAKYLRNLNINLLHGDFHIGNVRVIEEQKELVGFLDPRPMLGPRIVDLLKWAIVRDDPTKHDWYFSPKLLKDSIKYLDKAYRSGAMQGEPFTPEELKTLSILLRTHFLLDFAIQKTMSDEKKRYTFEQLEKMDEFFPYDASPAEIYRLMMDRDYSPLIKHNDNINDAA